MGQMPQRVFGQRVTREAIVGFSGTIIDSAKKLGVLTIKTDEEHKKVVELLPFERETVYF